MIFQNLNYIQNLLLTNQLWYNYLKWLNIDIIEKQENNRKPDQNLTYDNSDISFPNKIKDLKVILTILVWKLSQWWRHILSRKGGDLIMDQVSPLYIGTTPSLSTPPIYNTDR